MHVGRGVRSHRLAQAPHQGDHRNAVALHAGADLGAVEALELGTGGDALGGGGGDHTEPRLDAGERRLDLEQGAKPRLVGEARRHRGVAEESAEELGI